MNTIKHTEYKHNGRRVILDTCELAPGKYETMLLYPNGEEITSRTARTEADAPAAEDIKNACHRTESAVQYT